MNNKSLSIAFLAAILLSGLLLVNAQHFGTVQAATEVNGILFSDTTWSKAASPINMTGPTAIAKGVTLTIEPGVFVDFNTYTLEVNGTFRAIGTSAEPITLDGDWSGGPFIRDCNGILEFTNESDSWNNQTGTGCIIENVNATSLSIFIYDTTVKLNNNVFSGFHEFHGFDVYGGNSVISNSLITDGAVVVHGGSPVFIANNFTGEHLSLKGGSPTIENNLFYGEHSGISVSDGSNVRVVNNIIAHCNGFSTSRGGNVTFEHNIVLHCSGLSLLGPRANITVQNNTIAFNEFGIQSHSPSTKIIFNNLENNTQYNLSLGEGDNLDASYNWWGTTDVSAISQTIVDYNDNYNLGNVTFTPFLDAPNPQAPLISSFVEPSPSPSPSPTSTPTQTPTPTTTPEQQPSPTPSQEPPQAEQEVIIGVAITAAVVGAGLGLLLFLVKRK